MIGEIFENTVIQILFTVGLISLFGLAVWLLNRTFYKLIGKHGKAVCYATGFIGTPVHELGHAFFCVLFGHKITEIKLYQIDNAEGTLGYVKHKFNPKNIFHQIGNFFIGIGPVIFGNAVLLLLMLVLVPDILGGLSDTMNLFALLDLDLFNIDTFSYIGQIIWEVVTTVFAFGNANNIFWWLFIILASSITIHMSVSIPDIKTGIIGFIFITVTLLAVNAILGIINAQFMYTLTEFALIASSFILNFMIVSIFLSLVLLFLASMYKGAAKLLPKIIRKKI